MTNHPLGSTERCNPASANFDQLSTLEMVRLMNREDAHVPLAIAPAVPQIAQVVELMAERLAGNGRIFYQGAGTSGRLAVLDAVELLPTFSLEPGRVVPLLAGGTEAMFHSIEGAEDDPLGGKMDLAKHDFGSEDMLIAIAASGRTPYALGGLAYAAEIGAQSAAIVCNLHTPMADAAKTAIELIVGPEVLTGSTRLKAGSAQKFVLNMLSTCTMAKLGKVYNNLMVDVRPSNSKLRKRAVRIVQEVADLAEGAARELLEETRWDVKLALLSALSGAEIGKARKALNATNGQIRAALAKLAF